MQVALRDAEIRRGAFVLRCDAAIGEGVHLVSGPVGSGKSTLALLLASILAPDSGSVDRHGVSSCLLSLQFPEYHVTCSTAAEEVLSWGLKPDPVLGRAGLAGRGQADPLTLSRGELKRLNLACVFSCSPDLLLLDEPFSSLDCAAKVRVCRAIEARKGGITIVFSHERAVLPRVGTLWEMEGGRLSRVGDVPDAIPRWRFAPQYLRHALERGARPANIALTDAREALCRIRD
ncbi:MAG: ATP-binding cassette domain-containing protein [Methanomicrobiaceae archaeon]|uniref:Atpase component biom of energizing module of biotin ecf transporter n=1 Tax=hydrocarbon metagenome TaxID=938273 RepID=A0A0W8FDT3_9ZZZZ|nr:ATP-binding cassette domain-containing protein [Methanomicrobiaceae archaeon]MDD5420008.1 ATP-binding cassette domain-containing protein [Methanomicrobiaceae archaeon]